MENKEGRPTVMTEETLHNLEGSFLDDLTDIQACYLADISPSTLYNYQKEHPEFLERKRALRENVQIKVKRNIKKALEAEDMEVSKWYAERKMKDEGFGLRTEISGPNGKDITVNLINYAGNNPAPQLPTEGISVTLASSS